MGILSVSPRDFSFGKPHATGTSSGHATRGAAGGRIHLQNYSKQLQIIFTFDFSAAATKTNLPALEFVFSP
jgi:hypothetical protein